MFADRGLSDAGTGLRRSVSCRIGIQNQCFRNQVPALSSTWMHGGLTK